MRQHTYTKRKVGERQFEINLIVPGLAAATGRPSDRFRCSAETRDEKTFQARRTMVSDLGKRLLFNVLQARLDGKFTTERLAIVYSQGNAAFAELVKETEQSKHKKLLAPLKM